LPFEVCSSLFGPANLSLERPRTRRPASARFFRRGSLFGLSIGPLLFKQRDESLRRSSPIGKLRAEFLCGDLNTGPAFSKSDGGRHFVDVLPTRAASSSEYFYEIPFVES
jgi:hypothetical protein